MSHSTHLQGDPIELAALHAAGALTPQLADEFESLAAKGREPWASTLRRFGAVEESLIDGIEPVPVDGRVRADLLRRIGEHIQAAGGIDSARPTTPRSRDSVQEALPDGRGAAQEEHLHPDPQVWKHWRADDPDQLHTIIRNAAGNQWEDTGIEGIRIRRLSADPARNQMSMLVRMAAGTGYPAHVHNGPEECMVLEGDLRTGEHVLRAGDYQRMTPGSRHGYQSTEGGCLLFIVSSLTDELV